MSGASRVDPLPATVPDDGRPRTAAAFVLGWACAICIFASVPTADRLLRRGVWHVDPWEVVLVAVVVTVYAMSTAWWAYALVGWFARRNGPGGKPWSAYCKAGLAASVPYFGICLLLCRSSGCPGTGYWLAGLASSIAYASIGYWLVERGWPWRRRGSRPSEEPAGASGAGGAA